MLKALSIVARAVELWWRELLLLTLFNIAWFALQIPIITGPPATAAMYLITRRVIDGEILEPRHGWIALRHVFFPAIQWGVVNVIVFGVAIANFLIYQDELGLGWTMLRLVWGTITLGWFAINLYYWPFWLSQEDRSLITALRNGLLFMARRPGLALTMTLISAALIIVSVLTTLPLVTILVVWLALMGWLAVDEELE